MTIACAGRRPRRRSRGAAMARFAGKIAVLTGAASGLGREVVLAMAGEGAAGLLLLDRDAEGLAAIAEDAGGRGKARIETVALDVADSGAMAEAAGRARAAFGGVDILICAAGILGPTLPVVDYPEEAWDRVFAVNVRGTYLAARHFVPLIRARGGGAIVNFAST